MTNTKNTFVRKIKWMSHRTPARIVALVLAVLLVMNVTSILTTLPVFAGSNTSTTVQSEAPKASVTNDEMQISGNGSVGNLLSNEINKSAAAKNNAATNEGYSVTEVEMNGKKATVKYSARDNCTLIVGIYTDDGSKMLGSGNVTVTAANTSATVNISISEMPQYYLLKAFLVNPANNYPLCEEYVGQLHTKNIQDIKEATIDDFDDREVINFDNDNTTNFAVYSDDVLCLEKKNNTNLYSESLSTTGKYVFTNADESLRSLAIGDLFSYNDPSWNDDGLIIKVKTINVVRESNGMYTVTITEDSNVEMEDVFDFVKIENNGKFDSCEVNPCADNTLVDYLGTSSSVSPSPTPEGSISQKNYGLGGSYEWTIIDRKFSLHVPEKELFGGNVNVTALSGTLEVKLSAKVEFYYSLSEKYLNIQTNVTGEFDIEATVEMKISIPLCESMDLTFLDGRLMFQVKPAFTVELDVAIKGGITFNYTCGYEYCNNQGRAYSNPATITSDIQIEGTLFIGLTFENEVSLKAKHMKVKNPNESKFFCVEYNLKAGAEAKGTLTLISSEQENNPDSKHLCKKCIDGDYYFILEQSYKFTFFRVFSDEYINSFSVKIGDWYYSFDHKSGSFWGECPHIGFKISASVKDDKLNPIAGATIYNAGNMYAELAKTDLSGNAEFYLEKGDYNLAAMKDGYFSTVTLLGLSQPQSIVFTATGDNQGGDSSESDEWNLRLNIRDKASGNPVSGASVIFYLQDDTSPFKTVTSDSNGLVSVYLPCMDFRIVVDAEGMGYGKKEIVETVTTSPKTVNIDLNLNDQGNIIETGKCGDDITYTLYESGLLELNGSGEMNSSPWNSKNRNKIVYIRFIGNITSILKNAFEDCDNLKSVNIPNSVTSIGRYAFRSCDNLLSVIIPNTVTSINESTFENCDSLASVTIPNSVTSIGRYAFKGCSSLTSITIPDSVSSIEAWAFVGSGLNSVTIPKSISYISQEAFLGCQSLTTVVFPKSLTEIGYRAFENCNIINYNYLGAKDDWKKIHSVSIGALNNKVIHCNNGDISIIASGLCGLNCEYRLYDDGDLIIHGSGKMETSNGEAVSERYGNKADVKRVRFQGNVTSIGDLAFCDCINLKDIIIPNTITEIGDSAFWDCNSLKNIIIPDSSIGQHAFAHCDNLTDVFYTGSEEDWSGITIYDLGNDPINNATIHYNSTGPSSSPTPMSTPSSGNVLTSSFTNLVPNENYLFVVSKSSSLDNMLNASNLLFIDEKTAGSNGKLTFNYIPRETFSGAVVKVFGLVNTGANLDFTILGASIRLTEPYGIRFGIQLGKGGDFSKVNIVDYGTLMKPTQILGNEELTLQTAKVQKIPAKVIYSETDAARVYTGVLINIPVSYFDTAISGRGYLTYKDSSGVNHTIYTDTVSMSFNQVVDAAYAKYSKITNPTSSQKTILKKLEDLLALRANNDPVDTVIESGKCGDNINYTLYDSGLLELNGTGDMPNYTSSTDGSTNAPWNSNRTKIKQVRIKGKITSIGNRAFYFCESLSNVIMSDSITRIGDYAFYYCRNLSNIIMSDGLKSIGEGAFCECRCLDNLTIPNAVMFIGDYAFSGCWYLSSIIIPSSVTSIGKYVFSGCRYLTSIVIPNTVTSIGESAFYLCTDLTSIMIPDSVTSIDTYAFWRCHSLTAINVSSNNNYFTSINGVLYNKNKTILLCCPAGKKGAFSIPNSVTTIGNSSFNYCTGISSITIPNSVTSIGERTFEYCENLTNVTIPNSVTSIGERAFEDCDSLKSVVLPNSITAISDYVFCSCNSLSSIVIPNSVKSIGSYSFDLCDNLLSITIPETVTRVSDYAFWRCDSLTDVYYKGSKEKWQKMVLENNNDGLTNATIHYNS